jgi:hypothetical protein|tara:strand:+ start:2492 stop:2719 length:228 start_codon:yes stop_codon:yes gene_type:complete
VPKYYVTDGVERAVISSDDPYNAVCECVLERFSTFVVNGLYIVSEKGFDTHPDDLAISSNTILNILVKRKKDGEL